MNAAAVKMSAVRSIAGLITLGRLLLLYILGKTFVRFFFTNFSISSLKDMLTIYASRNHHIITFSVIHLFISPSVLIAHLISIHDINSY